MQSMWYIKAIWKRLAFVTIFLGLIVAGGATAFVYDGHTKFSKPMVLCMYRSPQMMWCPVIETCNTLFHKAVEVDHNYSLWLDLVSTNIGKAKFENFQNNPILNIFPPLLVVIPHSLVACHHLICCLWHPVFLSYFPHEPNLLSCVCRGAVSLTRVLQPVGHWVDYGYVCMMILVVGGSWLMILTWWDERGCVLCFNFYTHLFVDRLRAINIGHVNGRTMPQLLFVYVESLKSDTWVVASYCGIICGVNGSGATGVKY
jgi:hypothetical protein